MSENRLSFEGANGCFPNIKPLDSMDCFVWPMVGYNCKHSQHSSVPVGSTVLYEVMKLCTGPVISIIEQRLLSQLKVIGNYWYWVSVWQSWLVLSGTGSVISIERLVLDISGSVTDLYNKKVEIWLGVTDPDSQL